MSTVSSFTSIENKHDVYRGKDCMKKFCESLREHATKINKFEKKKMKLLTNEQQNWNQNSKICYICKEKFEDKNLKINIVKLGTIVIIQENIEVLHRVYVI